MKRSFDPQRGRDPQVLTKDSTIEHFCRMLDAAGNSKSVSQDVSVVLNAELAQYSE